MNDTINKLKDSLEITVVNGGAVVMSTMTEVEQGLRIVSLLLAVTYTAFRLYDLWKKNQK